MSSLWPGCPASRGGAWLQESCWLCKLMVRVGCADTPGRFEFHCNVQDHYKAGMKGVLEVQPKVGVLSQGQLPIWRRRRALT